MSSRINGERYFPQCQFMFMFRVIAFQKDRVIPFPYV